MTSFESLRPYRSYLLMQVKNDSQNLGALNSQFLPDIEKILREMLGSALDVQAK